jgi:PAS domain S-box-containing protein
MATAAIDRPSLFEGSFKAAFEHNMDGVLITAPDGRIFAANPAASDILGATEEEICLKGRQGFSDPADPQWAAALQERARCGQVRAILPMRRANGASFLAEVASSIFSGPEGEPRSCVIIRDVTERVRLEQQLRATHEITQELLSGTDTGEILGMIASRARMLVDATDAAIFRAIEPPGNGSNDFSYAASRREAEPRRHRGLLPSARRELRRSDADLSC